VFYLGRRPSDELGREYDCLDNGTMNFVQKIIIRVNRFLASPSFPFYSLVPSFAHLFPSRRKAAPKSSYEACGRYELP